MTEPIVAHSIQEAMRHGVQEFCICPGKRNAPFIAMLTLEPKLKCYYFYDERSAASFALGAPKPPAGPSPRFAPPAQLSHTCSALPWKPITPIPL